MNVIRRTEEFEEQLTLYISEFCDDKRQITRTKNQIIRSMMYENINKV